MRRIFRTFAKIADRIHLKLIRCLLWFNVNTYMKKIVAYYRKKGMDIPGMPRYIYNDTYFDPKDYGIIHIGKGCTVSREVMFLTHDYSMHTVFSADMNLKNAEAVLKKDKEDSLLVLKPIYLEDDVFVGARVSLLGGTHIWHNSIVGAGSVVKGTFEPESIIVGNPAKCVGKVSDWLDKKFEVQV